MPDHHPDSRRRLLRLALGGAIAAPLAGLLHTSRATGAEKARLDRESELAQKLAYTHDAESTNDSARKEGAHCGNCTHFRGGMDDQWASCNIFPEHLVNVNGWCKSWFAKSG